MKTEPQPDSRHLLRQESLRRRDALSKEERRGKSEAIARLLAGHPVIGKAQSLFTYANFRSEVETLGLIGTWLAAGKVVSVPLTVPVQAQLQAFRIHDPAGDLRPGYCRIPEPDPHHSTPVDPATIDLIILPGALFDLDGGRLGYGGGYYDRFIAQQAPQAIRIGLAFELQVTERLPLLPHDQRLHALITEERVIDFSPFAPELPTARRP